MQDYPALYALLAGAISFLSPCVLPLVPPYLGYMAGTTVTAIIEGGEEEDHKHLRRQVVFHALLFVLGFSIVFISLGMSATAIGKLLFAYSYYLSIIAGIVIIVMGLHFIGVFRFTLLEREARFQTNKQGYLGSFAMGLAFAFGWTPCIGPILTPILGLAGSKETVVEGGLLLAVYSAGLGIPFLLSALFIGPFMSFFHSFKHHLSIVEKIVGVLLVITGILFLSGRMQVFSYWLLDAFPFLSKIG